MAKWPFGGLDVGIEEVKRCWSGAHRTETFHIARGMNSASAELQVGAAYSTLRGKATVDRRHIRTAQRILLEEGHVNQREETRQLGGKVCNTRIHQNRPAGR